MSKDLVQSITLEQISEDISKIHISLSILVMLNADEIKNLSALSKGEESTELGVMSFSVPTSDLIKQAAEAIKKEMLIKKSDETSPA